MRRSQKRRKDCQVKQFFALLGSARGKDAHRTLMKLTPNSVLIRLQFSRFYSQPSFFVALLIHFKTYQNQLFLTVLQLILTLRFNFTRSYFPRNNSEKRGTTVHSATTYIKSLKKLKAREKERKERNDFKRKEREKKEK